MSQIIKVQTAPLSDKIAQYEEIDQEMQNVFYGIKKEINDLMPYWDSPSAEVEFQQFRTFFEQLDAISQLNKLYISFLKNTVVASHEEFENKLNKNVDEALDVEG